jgi:4-hydroxyphenylpyruvate dioxygenase-like putative hemolysin
LFHPRDRCKLGDSRDINKEVAMAIGKLDHLDFSVANLKKAQDYLVKKMGFTFIRQNVHDDKSISIEMRAPAGDFVIQIHEASEEALKKRKESAEYPMYFNHIAFKPDNINKTFEELKKNGVSFRQKVPTLNPVTGRMLANAVDEDGHHWVQLTD